MELPFRMAAYNEIVSVDINIQACIHILGVCVCMRVVCDPTPQNETLVGKMYFIA